MYAVQCTAYMLSQLINRPPPEASVTIVKIIFAPLQFYFEPIDLALQYRIIVHAGLVKQCGK